MQVLANSHLVQGGRPHHTVSPNFHLGAGAIPTLDDVTINPMTEDNDQLAEPW